MRDSRNVVPSRMRQVNGHCWLQTNAQKGQHGLQYDGFVHNFEKCAYVFSSFRAINRPSKCVTSSETTRPDKGISACLITSATMDTSGSDLNAKEDHTALQYEGFVHVFRERASSFSTCRAIECPLKCFCNHRCKTDQPLKGHPIAKQNPQWT